MSQKTKIVLDADVIIHFAKAVQLTLLLDIFPEYEYILLSVVYEEITRQRSFKLQIDRTLQFFQQRLTLVPFSPRGDSMREYAMLLSSFGRGESACMVYCRDHLDVLGSSNLRDIKQYCESHNITYLTTIDFLYYAYVRHKLTKEECDQFIADVINKGSRLPQIDISQYACAVQI